MSKNMKIQAFLSETIDIKKQSLIFEKSAVIASLYDIYVLYDDGISISKNHSIYFLLVHLTTQLSSRRCWQHLLFLLLCISLPSLALKPLG